MFPYTKYIKQEILKEETQSSKTFNCLIKKQVLQGRKVGKMKLSFSNAKYKTL